ncbi:MAG: diguanylate cyclase [Thermoanaerobaculia bacterium]
MSLPPGFPLDPDDEELSYEILLSHSRLVELVARGCASRDVLAEMVRLVEHRFAGVLPVVLGWDVKRRRLEVLASAGVPHELLEALDGLPRDRAEEMFPALESGEISIVESIAAQTRLAPLAERAALAGVGACWTAPIVLPAPAEGRGQALIAGIVVLFHPAARPPAGRGRKLLDLLARLAALAIERDAFEQRATRERALDSLTRLPNRILFDRILQDLIELADPERTRFALLLVDIDDFLALNRSYGFRVGDLVLASFARRLEGSLRRGDLVARIEGDRFALVVRFESDAEEARQAGARFLRELRRGFDFEGQKIELSASLGAALYPWDGLDAHTLLANAETAVGAAYAEGGDRLLLFSAELLRPPAAPRTEEPRADGSAVEPRDLELLWELRFRLPSCDPEGVTARLLWNHPRRGRLGADAVWAVAERDLSLAIVTPWLLGAAARGIAALRAPRAPLRLVVPLSATHVGEARVESWVREALTATGLAPARLELELPAAALARAPAEAIARFGRLARLGVRIAASGIGGADLPLELCRLLELAAWKLDPALMRAARHGGRDESIFAGLLAFARRVGFETIAEEVETSLEVSWLGVQRCDLVTGPALRRPMPADQLARILAEIARGAALSGSTTA